jgi:hypothetical protein
MADYDKIWSKDGRSAKRTSAAIEDWGLFAGASLLWIRPLRMVESETALVK